MANIYGDDNNDFASSIASDALGKPSANRHGGAPTGEAGSKGVSPQDKGEVSKTSIGTGSDSRAVSKGDCPK